MGLIDFLKSGFTRGFQKRLEVTAPSPEFATQVDAIEHVIANIEPDGWATFVARDGSKDLIIQTLEDSINTCMERVDVAAIATTIGMTVAADAIELQDRSVHLLRGATPRELAELVNAIYIHHYRLPAHYRIEGRLGDY